MNKPSILLIGAGGHARSCIDIIEQQGKYQIEGLVGLKKELNSQHFGYKVIATDDSLDKLAKSIPYALITIGQIQTAKHRMRLYQQAVQSGFLMPSIIAPTARVSSHASVGAGTIIMHGATLIAGAKVGNNCIVNTLALLEHEVTVEDNCHISTGAVLNGEVIVRSGSFIGSGCVVKEGLSIGKDCIVGIGLTVRHNLDDSTCFTGHTKS